MELKIGYKQTEVGVIPSDWKVIRLGNVANIEGGFAFKSKSFTPDGDFQVVKMSNLYQGNLDLSRSSSFLKSIESVEEHYLLKENEILITLTGTIGKKDYGYTYRIRNEKKLLLNQRVARIIPTNNINPIYLDFHLKTEAFLTQFFDASRGGTGNQTNVGTKDVEEVLIPLPHTHAEQTAIATALSDTDQYITHLEILIAKKRNIKQGAMQELLKPKEGWVVKILGESSEISRGGSPRPIEDFLTTQAHGINWIKIGDVGKGAKYIEATEEKIIPEGVSRSRYVKEGDFILSNSMSFGRPYILKINGCIHDGWLVIQNYQDNFDSDFLYYVLGSDFVLNQYKAMASGSSVLNLNKEIVKKVKINCPKEKAEQTIIATILSDMDTELTTLETKLTKAKSIKQGMMQQLLTGKIRLI